MSKFKPDFRILLVDDDDGFRDITKQILEEEGISVVTAQNGLEGQGYIETDKFDLIISDIRMGGVVSGGIELLHFAKRMTSTPVILMTGFSQIMEVHEAISLGVSGFLAKPFQKNELLQAIDSACGVENPDIEKERELEQNYCRMTIDDFVSGKKIQFSIYIKLSKFKYVKIANEAEDISLDRIKSLKQKGVYYLYLEREDFYEYMKMTLAIGKVLRNDKKISKEKVLRLMKHTVEVLFEYTHAEDFNQEAFLDAKNIAENTVYFLAESEKTFDLLSTLNAHSDFLYAHSLGVSLYSVMIARQIGWSSQETLYKVSIAGLLHDIGLKEIDKDILYKERINMLPEELKVYESHVTRGMEILSKVPTIPADLAQAVLHHHERDGGRGYPNHIHKSKTHPIARVIAVADEFCDLVIANPNSAGLSPREGLIRLVKFHEQVLDMDLITALSKVVRERLKE